MTRLHYPTRSRKPQRVATLTPVPSNLSHYWLYNELEIFKLREPAGLWEYSMNRQLCPIHETQNMSVIARQASVLSVIARQTEASSWHRNLDIRDKCNGSWKTTFHKLLDFVFSVLIGTPTPSLFPPGCYTMIHCLQEAPDCWVGICGTISRHAQHRTQLTSIIFW